MPCLPSVELQDFAYRVFLSTGAPEDNARIVAAHLVDANLLGFDSHGVIRIPAYLDLVRNGSVQPHAPLTISKETETTALVDCGWNFGQVGARAAIMLGIEKAHGARVAAIGTHRCGHAGRLGTYTHLAAEQGLVALAFCNSWKGGHFVLPWGGTKGRLATNPMSYAAPCDGASPIIADFSTAETAEGVLRVFRNQGKSLPPGWIVDADGSPSQDPNAFYGPPRGAILPFGGQKGYRGFALGLLVEIMAGVLGGANRVMENDGNGLFFIVIDPEAFQSGEQFSSLMRETRDYIKSAPSQNGTEVLMPGEPDLRVRERRLREGIPLDENTWSSIVAAANAVGVTWPEVKPDVPSSSMKF